MASTLHTRGHVVRLVDAESIPDVSSEIEVVQSQINASNLVDYVSDVDVVINCLPGRIGVRFLRTLSVSMACVWPIWHSLPKTHKQLTLAETTLIYDVGIAPGLQIQFSKQCSEWELLIRENLGRWKSSATR